MDIDPKQLEQFFLRSAAKTYASGAKAFLSPPLPGARMYIEIEEPLLYRDIYRVNGEFSAGWTTIERDGAVVWSMYYHGWCQSEDRGAVIDFLKGSLREAYDQGLFFGGRGPGYLSRELPNAEILEYFNQPEEGRFESFSGRETIEWSSSDTTEDDDPVVFWHEYQGMLLLPEVA